LNSFTDGANARSNPMIVFQPVRGYVDARPVDVHENHRRLHSQTTIVGGKSARCSRPRRAEAAGLQEPTFLLARGNERVETNRAAATGATVAREMNELILGFNAAGIALLEELKRLGKIS
jgi:hypothetical protein